MRAFLISLLATISSDIDNLGSLCPGYARPCGSTTKPGTAFRPWSRCMTAKTVVGLCARIVQRLSRASWSAGQQNYLLIRNLQPQRNGTFKGIINPPSLLCRRLRPWSLS